VDEIRQSFDCRYEEEFAVEISKNRRKRNDSNSSRSTQREHGDGQRKTSNSEQVNKFDLDEQISQARRLIGITNIDDFYKLTPFEFNDLCRGALLAQYDDLENSRVKSAMVQPVGLIEDIQTQNRSVDSTIREIKDFATNFGKEASATQNKQIDAQAFYDLVMKRGRE
jgi:hypothetical protein